MGKKGKGKIEQGRLWLYRLNYECVRRNSRYRAEYAKRLTGIPGSDSRYDFLALDWGILRGDVLPDPSDRPPLDQALERPLPRNAGIPIAPSDFVMTHQMREAMDTIALNVGDMNLEQTALAGLVALVYFPEHSPAQQSVAVFDTRWSKKTLVAEFENWVNWVIDERARHRLKQARPSKRNGKDECVQYLRVYDLRTDGRTYREIAGLLWPEARGEVEQKAKAYYRKARSLVSVPPLLANRKWLREDPMRRHAQRGEPDERRSC